MRAMVSLEGSGMVKEGEAEAVEVVGRVLRMVEVVEGLEVRERAGD